MKMQTVNLNVSVEILLQNNQRLLRHLSLLLDRAICMEPA